MNKKWISFFVVLIVIGIAIFILTKKNPETPEAVAKCIGQNSVLYVQLGCHACAIQESIFGENYKYLNKIDCFFEKEKCTNIARTPTWLIKGKKYEGVLTIEKLKELTGC